MRRAILAILTIGVLGALGPVAAQPNVPTVYLPLVAVPPSATVAPPMPTEPVAPTAPVMPTSSPGCAPEYPTVCIPPPPPDLDCSDIPYRRFPVLPPDRHRFDTDNDGVGCESG